MPTLMLSVYGPDFEQQGSGYSPIAAVSGLFTFRGSISGERRANGESVQR